MNIWARNTGKRIPARVPDGCLLVQAGKQLEWLSGGLIKGGYRQQECATDKVAGFHEVICNEATLAAIERRKQSHPDRPLIRISSTFVSFFKSIAQADNQFWHLTPDLPLAPMPELRKRAEDRFGPQKDYGEAYVGEQVKAELGLIKLMPKDF